MSKGTVQRKTTSKRDPSMSDNEVVTNRRRPCYELIQKEKQRKIIAMNDNRKNQLGILHELLSNERNENIKLNKSEKLIPKNNIIRNGKNNFNKTINDTSVKTPNSLSQSEEILNKSVHSADEEVVENEPVRLSRSNRKDDQQHRATRSTSLYSQSRQHSNDVRSINNVSFMSDKSKNGIESPGQLKKLLTRLSSEFTDLESITGFKPNKTGLSSNTCSTSLATALIKLTGHVKQCASNTKEIDILKNQLSIVIKTQLDFQQKIENQITTLQTMMQTLCQLVNNEIISNKKSNHNQTDFQIPESHQNWLTNAQRPYLIPKDTNNAMDELLLFTRRMNNTTPIDINLSHPFTNNHHSAYIETLEASKKLTRPTPSMSTKETNDKDNSKQIQRHRNFDQQSCLSMVSPNNILFHPNGNLSTSIFRNEIGGLGGISTTVPSASTNETIVEKILQERLRLVQQMAELNKQHETTQEELANLETKTVQTRAT